MHRTKMLHFFVTLSPSNYQIDTSLLKKLYYGTAPPYNCIKTLRHDACLSERFFTFATVKRFVYILLVAVPLVACLLLGSCGDNPRAVSLLAHYLLGRTYADTGEAPQAINAYSEAANRADTTAADCDYRTLSRVHAQTAQLYYSQLLPDYMIRHERLAMKYAEAAKDTMAYLACYAMLAEGYETKNMNDSALLILSDAYSLYKKIGEDQMASKLCCSMADICRQQKDYPQAE